MDFLPIIFRELRILIIFFGFALFLGACSDLEKLKAIQKLTGDSRYALDELDESQIRRKEAVAMVTASIGAATSGCEYFYDSPWQMPLNWFYMVSEVDCGDYSLYDCKDRYHVKRDSVESCIISISLLSAACRAGEIETLGVHFAAFSECADALESKWQSPLFYF